MPDLSDEAVTVLWAACHLIQSTKALALSSPSFQAISVAGPKRNDLDMQTMRLRTGIALGFVNPMNLDGFA
jgi:hypothetical protein